MTFQASSAESVIKPFFFQASDQKVFLSELKSQQQCGSVCTGAGLGLIYVGRFARLLL